MRSVAARRPKRLQLLQEKPESTFPAPSAAMFEVEQRSATGLEQPEIGRPSLLWPDEVTCEPRKNKSPETDSPPARHAFLLVLPDRSPGPKSRAPRPQNRRLGQIRPAPTWKRHRRGLSLRVR